VDERAVAGGDRLGELDGLAEGDAGAAVVAGSVDEFGDEAAVQDELAWGGEDVQVTGDEADSVGGAGAVVDGESVPGGELVGESGLADAVAAFQGEGAVFSGELVEFTSEPAAADRADQ
jgi:hypothetical protein